MPLINCPDCKKEVSSNAPACPGCGSPIAQDTEAQGSGVNRLSTIQETSKKFKVQSLLSLFLFFSGFAVMWLGTDIYNESMSSTGALMIVAGIVWYLVNRFRIWWHHK